MPERLGKLNRAAPESYSDQAKTFTDEEILSNLDSLNGRLAKVGVKSPIQAIIDKAILHSWQYEVEMDSQHREKPTAHNCMAALLIYLEPDVLKEADWKKKSYLFDAIARISIYVVELASRSQDKNPYQLPDRFSKPPQTLE